MLFLIIGLWAVDLTCSDFELSSYIQLFFQDQFSISEELDIWPESVSIMFHTFSNSGHGVSRTSQTLPFTANFDVCHGSFA